MPGIKSAKEFLYFIQQSRQVANRPHQEVFHELIFGKYGDLARCDYRNYPNVLVGNADDIQKVAQVGVVQPKASHFYDFFVKKYNTQTALMGNNKAKYEEPLKKCFSDHSFIQQQIMPMKLLTEKFTGEITRFADSYTKVITELKLL